jgi:hypothetical protein
MTNAIRTAPPPATPVIRATLLLDELLVRLELLELDVGLDVGVITIVDDMTALDNDELALRHEELLDPETCSNPGTPPCLPSESVTRYRRLVPALTSTTEEKVSLFELNTTGCPPGMSCTIVMGRTALLPAVTVN